jgi:RNA polymerase II subunit A small phosphatase-like protein
VDKPLLILDLDETLIFASEQRMEREPDFTCGPYSIYCRPHLDEFFREIVTTFRFGVWTSATEDYMECVVKNVIPKEIELAFVFGGQRCTQVLDPNTGEMKWVKDLKKIKKKGYTLDRVIMVDDTASMLERNYGNLIRVSPWRGSTEDDELFYLVKYLNKISGVSSFRNIEKRFWRKGL